MAGATEHIAVLMGGLSAERDVSLVTGKACAKALGDLGYRVTEIDAGHDLPRQLADCAPDKVFNALHGRYGEDGAVQGLLEVMDIPYTHSGVLASAVAMDKARARDLFKAAGLTVAEGYATAVEDLAQDGVKFDPPYVIKPVSEGSSFGVSIIREGDNQGPDSLRDGSWPYGTEVLVERYIPGRELSVAVLNGDALGVVEIKPNHSGFYDYEAKYADGGSMHDIPAKIDAKVSQAACDAALLAHDVLGCRGVSRSDFRYDDDSGVLVILETNTQPGMTPTSLVPELAAAKNISFNDLIKILVEDASCQR